MKIPYSRTVSVLAFAVGLAGNFAGIPAVGQNSRQGSAQGLPDIDEIRNRARSSVELNTGSGSAEILLFAQDERGEILRGSYCGGNEGSTEYRGHYQLLSIAENQIVSEVALKPHYYFPPRIARSPLSIARDPNTGEELVVLLQYQGCNNLTAELFRVDGDRIIHRVPFLNRDGSRQEAVSTSRDSLEFSREREWVICWYNNVYGTGFCDSYKYEDGAFVQTLSWMGACLGQSRADGFCAALGESTRSVAGEARRTLHEFLFALDRGDYKAASYYYPSPNESLRELDPALDPAIELLERHCKRDGGGCLTPLGNIYESDVMNFPLVFAASFRTPDGDEYTVGARTSFEFRVAPTGNGYKVLDLPPTGPPPPP